MPIGVDSIPFFHEKQIVARLCGFGRWFGFGVVLRIEFALWVPDEV
jgi:hypothetical protein